MSSEVYSTHIYPRIQDTINDRLHGNLSPISIKRRSYTRGKIHINTTNIIHFIYIYKVFTLTGHVSCYSSEICTACSKLIEDVDLIVRLNKNWHRNCFRLYNY